MRPDSALQTRLRLFVPDPSSGWTRGGTSGAARTSLPSERSTRCARLSGEDCLGTNKSVMQGGIAKVVILGAPPRSSKANQRVHPAKVSSDTRTGPSSPRREITRTMTSVPSSVLSPDRKRSTASVPSARVPMALRPARRIVRKATFSPGRRCFSLTPIHLLGQPWSPAASRQPRQRPFERH